MTGRDASAPGRQILVSIHDVTPAHAVRIQKIFDLFSDVGLARYALLVIPDYHRGWPLDRHTEFAADLRRRQDAGMEIFLHGLWHDEVGLRRSVRQVLIGAGRTSREAEFLLLKPAEAADRIDRGLEMLRTCGLAPVGFVPPGWLFGEDTVRIIRQRNLPITEGIVVVTDTHTGRRRIAPALGWDTRTRWLAVACAGLAAIRRRLEWSRLVRVAIHPQDIDDPVAGPSLRNVLRKLLETREAVSYRTALAIR